MPSRPRALLLFAVLQSAPLWAGGETRQVSVPSLPGSVIAVAREAAPNLKDAIPGVVELPVAPAVPMSVPVGAAAETPVPPVLSGSAEVQAPGPTQDLSRAAVPAEGRDQSPEVFDGTLRLTSEAGAVYAPVVHETDRLERHVRVVKVQAAPAAAAREVSGTEGLSGTPLLSSVRESARRGHHGHEYKDAMHFLFSSADHVVVGGVSGVVDAYSGVFVPGTSGNGGDYKEPGDKNGDGYEDKGGMNVEHGFPQSLFGRGLPMRSDLHHLLATFMHPNSERSNLPFGEVTGKPEYTNNAGAKMGGGVFEPPDFTKGRVARAMLYFYARYGDQAFFDRSAAPFWNRQIETLLRWNRLHPPDADEMSRNDRVEAFQGNRNPFIDDPSLADRVGAAALRHGLSGGGSRAVADAQAGARPPRLIITGPPGSGKGTFSERIAAERGLVHISVGDLLRDYALSHPEVAAIMASGKLVDSALVLRVVRERLAEPEIRQKGFILDGFPRRPEEAAALEAMLGSAEVDGVVVLDASDAELLRRVKARGRPDDKEDVFHERMRIYWGQTVPAVARFADLSPVVGAEVAGHDVDANYARVKAAVSDLLKTVSGR